MRRLIILVAVASAAVALQTGVALAGSGDLTLRGTLAVKFAQGSTWYLRTAKGQIDGSGGFICLQRSDCWWDFRFRSGSFEIKVHKPKIRAKTTLKAGVIDGTGGYAHDKGWVRIHFLTSKVARFTFHLTS